MRVTGRVAQGGGGQRQAGQTRGVVGAEKQGKFVKVAAEQVVVRMLRVRVLLQK